MPDPAAPLPEPATDATGGAAGELDLARQLLERLRAARESPGAALYLPAEGGLERRLVVGEGPFPRRLEDPGERGLRTVPLADGVVALAPGAGGGQPGEDLALALSAAARALRLRDELKAHSFAVKYRGVELEALYDVGLAIASTLDLEELCGEVLLRAVSLLDARRGALYLVQDGRYRLQGTIGGDARDSLEQGGPLVGSLLGSGEAGRVGEEVLPGARHLLAVPIELAGSPEGLLVVADKESRRGVGPFPAADRRKLSLFANQAAIALKNARLHRQALEKERLERELELAAEIQTRLLPTRVPELPGFEVLGWTRPARHVGGDYYDFLPLGDGGLALVVGDVAGKGMPAALMVSTLHSALRLLGEGMGVGPPLLARLNRHIHDSSQSNRFITLALVEAHPGVGEVRYLNAGHNPVLLAAAAGEVREIEGGGLPLGFLPDATFEPRGLGLEPGDLLCLYSDGITEAVAPGEVEFGIDRLAELLRAGRRRPLSEIVRAVDEATRRFAQGAPQEDDQTLVLLRRAG